MLVQSAFVEKVAGLADEVVALNKLFHYNSLKWTSYFKGESSFWNEAPIFSFLFILFLFFFCPQGDVKKQQQDGKPDGQNATNPSRCDR